MRALLVVLLCFVSGCGYTLRGNTRPLFVQNNIHNLYIPPVKNDSYKAGIEITVYNALRKKIAEGGYVRLVDKDSDSDAVFKAVVTDASYSPAAITTGDQISTGDPNNQFRKELSNIQVAKSYNVYLKVKFELRQIHPAKILWADEISQSKSFPATVFLGPIGDTSALINESEFEHCLSDLSASLVTDAEESIATIF